MDVSYKKDQTSPPQKKNARRSTTAGDVKRLILVNEEHEEVSQATLQHA